MVQTIPCRIRPTLNGFVTNFAQAFALNAASAAVDDIVTDTTEQVSGVIGGLSNLTALGRGLEVLARLPLPAPINFTLVNPVAAATLTVPLVGYAAAISDAATVASSAMSSCLLEGYPRYTPSVPTSYADAFSLFGPPDSAPDEEAPRLWQPWPFNLLNFVIDRQEFTMIAPTMCRRSYLASGMLAPQPLQYTSLLPGASSDPLLASAVDPVATRARFGPDPYPYRTALIGGLEGVFSAFERDGFRWDPIADCRAGAAPLVDVLPSNATATRQALVQTGWDGCRAQRFLGCVRTEGSATAQAQVVVEGTEADVCVSARVPRKIWSSAPRVMAMAADGSMVHGGECTVVESEAAGVLEWQRLRIEYECTEDANETGVHCTTHTGIWSRGCMGVRQQVMHGRGYEHWHG